MAVCLDTIEVRYYQVMFGGGEFGLVGRSSRGSYWVLVEYLFIIDNGRHECNAVVYSCV